VVKLQSLRTDAYIDARRGDILTTGRLGVASTQALGVLGKSPGACRQDAPSCVALLLGSDGLEDEAKLATAAELSVDAALRIARQQPAEGSSASISAWLDAARYAYAYLFFTARAPADRAFEDRQTQVRDYYNLAVQQAVSGLFARNYQQPVSGPMDGLLSAPTGWAITLDTRSLSGDNETVRPQAILPASSLRFEGLRSVYRRDGFGSEMVAVMPGASVSAGDATPATAPAFSEMPAPNVTMLLRFEGRSLAEVLATRRATLEAYDPYVSPATTIGTNAVLLAGNFSAGYGVWLARAGFANQSLRTLFGLSAGLDRPHIYLLQPYDPHRRVLVLLHGLASSPEAWVNAANELMGDEQIRRHFQVWLAYYPTSAPLPYNHLALRHAIDATLDHYDPHRTTASAHHMVLVGHSMGGVIARLMVSSSGGDTLWNALFDGTHLSPDLLSRTHRQLDPMLHFSPMPAVSEAIFIAAPHRGTPYAQSFVARVMRRLVTVPARLDDEFKDLAPAIADTRGRLPTSIDSLSDKDPFIEATSTLAIAPTVRYHTIVGREESGGALEDSSDGIVPYRSAHLEHAASECVIPAGHSVQETARAILEVRRILRAAVADDVTP
jgi:pimeloyl-ACP methyl ester carboxylesterase